jgi:elongation factor Ts
MAAITAALVKELRQRTGAGMMDCKKALDIANGDIQLAAEELRKSGRAKADKKASRIAAEGVILAAKSADQKHAVLMEINSETDFVARDENFIAFADAVINTVLSAKSDDVQVLAKLPLVNNSALTIDEARLALIAKVGENINIRRVAITQATTETIGIYLHGSRIGVLVELEGGTDELAKDIAMHIAANKPLVISPEEVSADLVAREKEIYLAQAASSGKPKEIIEKMVGGKLKKYLDEVSLLGQPFVKDAETTVGALLSKNRAKVISFARYEVGEGIEKQEEDFVEAVMAQVKGCE